MATESVVNFVFFETLTTKKFAIVQAELRALATSRFYFPSLGFWSPTYVQFKLAVNAERAGKTSPSLRVFATDIVVKQTGQEGSWHTIDIQCYLST